MPRILELGFTPWPLSPVPIGYETGWAPEPVWLPWRGEESFLTGTRTPTSSVYPLVFQMFVFLPTEIFPTGTFLHIYFLLIFSTCFSHLKFIKVCNINNKISNMSNVIIFVL
jgi:hypothetical protein